ncbi:membrane protein insertase YidC [Actibacterium sp. XHP0104]|uniref:membrane protein insertase YidC n=1 Tax=Actibacterium sp. XHP0104 TaxID=2984335 RepID=UPI0021E88C3B|nr:membrane protein insertase YidC [Actibacterium sp. XHP0104]MCV2882384.1 membrane protein insertase YidC [Actibacterium sp. XHP0104]
MDDQNKNLILASVLSFVVILVWFIFFPPEEQAPAPIENAAVSTDGVAALPPALAAAPSAVTTQAPAPVAAAAPRLMIDTTRLKGSISLAGGRIDQLVLKDYRETLEPDSANIGLLSPVGTEHPYYALYGWAPGGTLDIADVPGPLTEWVVEGNDKLTEATPVTLSWDNGKGLIFRRTISVDDGYMFTMAQSVENTGETPVRMAPYGLIARHGEPDSKKFFILHEGVVRQNDNTLEEISYKDMADLDYVEREGARAEVADITENGWIGFTDKYWMTTLVTKPGQPFTSVAKYVASAEIYQVEARMPVMDVAPGATASVETLLFAGAKEWEEINGYEEDLGIVNFVDSIDWGMFFFLTKPIFKVLHFLNGVIGNMGWAIIALTIFIKAILFPLAYKSYVSMAKMKELQPEMEKIKERTGDDRMKMQQEMMALYKKEKVNPASGCLPILLQIPIFFSLYKVIFVTIELYQAPWLGWIRDLSTPDPSSILNLFGLLPFTPPAPESMLAFISLGILPILLGLSMWLQQKLNPTPTDPVQKMIFAWMPWVFMFMLGNFASGLVLYWITNNTITFIQQYTIMRSHGHKPDLLGNMTAGLRKRKAEKK